MRDGERETSLSRAVVTAVADAENVDARELDPPLGTVVDADALNALFTLADGDGGTGRVTFRYNGYDVTVSHDGSVDLDRPRIRSE